MRDQKGAAIMNIDFERLAALFHDQLHRTFVVRGRWCDCSDTFQRAWEEAVMQALIRAASQEGDENGAATLILKRLSTPTGDRDTNSYTVAAVIFDELIQRYESGVAFFGLGVAWESRSEKAHEYWAVAVRRALARTALSGENPGGDGYCLFLPRESADRPAEGTVRPTSAESEPPAPPPSRPKRPWWKFWR
jgi:hypothetical protein